MIRLSKSFFLIKPYCVVTESNKIKQKLRRLIDNISCLFTISLCIQERLPKGGRGYLESGYYPRERGIVYRFYGYELIYLI